MAAAGVKRARQPACRNKNQCLDRLARDRSILNFTFYFIFLFFISKDDGGHLS
jgi:hypothetical protein